jgi:hypothetical protein
MADAPEPLAPGALRDGLDGILARAEGLMRSVPAHCLERRLPAGDRTVRDLAFEIFRRGLAFADAMDHGRLRESWLAERAPADLDEGPAIARYGALVRGRLAGWFEGAGPGEYARAIETGSGRQTGHHLLERTAAEAGERLARLEAVLADRDASAP